ncbi:MAG TPA: Rne/Rng family ribonuclease [Candidatus Aquirickettsiella sp.]|jgi:ribonuclease E
MHNEKNRILINANQPGEIRVALLEENKLSDLDIEYSGHEQKKSNIYKGKISRIEPSLEAAFIDYGPERHGFLPFKEIVPSFFKFEKSQSIQYLKKVLEGREVMVQIEKEERGNKGAALTTYITLPGSYLVLMPNNPGAGGISRRIEGEERREMQDLLSQMELSEDMGLILRTAGVGREFYELQNDLNLLIQQWNAIQKAYNERSAPFLIFQEGDLITRSIRDYLRRDIDEIIIDDKKIFEKIKNYIEQIRPDFVSRITLYQNSIPLFMYFDIEEAVESAFKRKIELPSGATIVIDRTEALVSIDINSGKSTKNEDIEETAVTTNLEAAKEIAHQLRVRDLGGLIVIDFIDMNSEDNQRKVENCLRLATKKDRARIQIGRISPFGLLEMSRQRLRHSLGKANETLCSRCNGEGTVRTIESLSLSLLRAIEKEALKKSTQQIRVEIPVDMATYLINEKRAAREQIEQRYKINILLIPNPYWQSPHYKITGQGKNINLQASENASYQMLDKSCAESSLPYSSPVIKPVEIPAVKPLTFAISKNKPKTQLGLLSRLLGMLKDLSKTKELSKNSVKKELATAQIYNHSNDAPHRHPPEKRYSKANRNNRLRSHRRDDRRDKEGEGGSEGGDGQHHHNGGKTSQNRYNKHHQQRYESAPHQQNTHHNNKPVSTPIAGASERKPLPHKRRQHSERSAIKHEHKINTQAIREENISSTPKPVLNNTERKTVIPSRSVEKSAPSIEKKPVAEQIANTANINSSKQTTNANNPSPQRRNTRRYGGEPKLRHRTYSHYEQDQKTKN